MNRYARPRSNTRRIAEPPLSGRHRSALANQAGLLDDPGPYGFAMRKGASLAGALDESCFHHAATWRLVVRVKILNIAKTKSFRDY